MGDLIQFGHGIDYKVDTSKGLRYVNAFSTCWCLDADWHVVSVVTSGRRCSFNRNGDYMRFSCDNEVIHVYNMPSGLIRVNAPYLIVNRDIRSGIAKQVLIRGSILPYSVVQELLEVSLGKPYEVYGLNFKFEASVSCLICDIFVIVIGSDRVYVYKPCIYGIYKEVHNLLFGQCSMFGLKFICDTLSLLQAGFISVEAVCTDNDEILTAGCNILAVEDLV